MKKADYVDTCEYEYLSGSGSSSNDCVVLGYRKPSGTPFSPFELESWLIHLMPTRMADGNFKVDFLFGNTRWLTGLWRSPAGVVYISDNQGLVHVCRNLERGQQAEREEMPVDAQLSGVWGLSDKCVFTWGRGAGKDNRLFRYDGRAWQPLPSPGYVSTLHGLAPDFLYAVGYDGLMARWDGHTWTPIPLDVESNFTGLFVAGPDEMYATTEGGELWEGTSHGWSKRAEMPGPLLDVAKYKGEIWVAGGEQGLLKLKGGTNELECIKPNIEAKSFDARETLLITTKDFVAYSADGVKFQGRGRETMQQMVGKNVPMWME